MVTTLRQHKGENDISAVGMQKSVKRLEALKERQLVSERRIKKDVEDSKKKLKQLENDSSKTSLVAEQEMMNLTENLQRSLQNRSMLEAKVSEMRPAQQRHALHRRAAEENAWNLLRDTQLIEEELCDLQKALRAKCEEKEKMLHELQLQREQLSGLSQEASRDAREAATLEAEATQLKAKATEEVQRELALDRAILARRTSLQCRIFRALAEYVWEHKREEEEERRRLHSWFCSKGPQFLRAWHGRAARLRSLRCAMDLAAAAQLQVAFQQWAEVVEEERLWSRFAPRVTLWRRRHRQRVALVLWRAGVKQSKRQDLWPQHRMLLSNVLQKWHEVSLVALHLCERLTWAETHFLVMQLSFQRAVLRLWQLHRQKTGARAKRLMDHCTFQRRKTRLRCWRTLWLFHGARGPLRYLARRCLRRVFRAFCLNQLLASLAMCNAQRQLRRSFDAWRRRRSRRQDKPVLLTLRPRRVLVVWGWWRFLAKQSRQLKARREKWTRFLLQKRLQHWHRFVELRQRTKRDAWRRFRSICSSRRRRRLLLEGLQGRLKQRALHQSFMAFMMYWERAARQKRQSMQCAQEECEALAERLQLAERHTQELQETRLSEEAAMEDLMTETRLLDFVQRHMHHELECHQKSQQNFEAVVASQTFELEEELRLTRSSQMTLEVLMRNEELRAEARTEGLESEGTKAPFRSFGSRLREMQAAAEARLKEKEEEVCSLRQSVLRSSQSQLRVKFANS